MAEQNCDLCGKRAGGYANGCGAGVDWNSGDVLSCDGSTLRGPAYHEAEIVRDYLRFKRDMPGIIETLNKLALDMKNGDCPPVHAMIAIGALAQQLQRDHIDAPIEQRLRKS